MKRWQLLIGGGAAMALVLALAIVGSRLQPAATPASRGALIADRLGCFTCHGPGGTAGIANPGSLEGAVPSWRAATARRYARDDDEIRAWILDGAPARLRPPAGGQTTTLGGGAVIVMPAYAGRLDERELADLVAYFKAVAGRSDWPDDPSVRAGYGAAERIGCFGCHGASGRVSMPNPGSLKGVIPAWDGADFAELVRDPGELRDWILDGGIARLREDPVARRVIGGQVISMPAYRDRITEEELAALIAYIRWLRPVGTL